MRFVFNLMPKMIIAALSLQLAACAVAPAAAPNGSNGSNASNASNTGLQQEVRATEIAFAKSMADRDFAKFSSFISEEAVFFSGPTPLHGKEQVVQFWKRFFEKPQAPFSWAPEKVEVLASGALALSTGPVYDPSGKLFAQFSSIWRLEAPGVWRIIFDKGNDVCDPK